MYSSVFEALAALLILVILGSSSISVLFVADNAITKANTEQTELYNLSSTAEAIDAAAYSTSGYSTVVSSTPNPHNVIDTVQVDNYLAGASPAFSQSYTDSGLQQITITASYKGVSKNIVIYKKK